MLQVHGTDIVDATGKVVWLRGTCIGGWMTLENFMNGFPGAESGLREAMAETIGAQHATFFFERLLDAMLSEVDIAFIASTGANVVRLPLNYRHFEEDMQPFVYREDGFARLDQAIAWCAHHGVYVILDLHAAQGWQSPDWHCDNDARHSFLWTHAHFQDRFVALWEELARRYRGNATVAGYNLLNEPVTNAERGRFTDDYTSHWAPINQLYRRTVAAIRAIDSDHIIFLEGDFFSQRFNGLAAPFADNLVFSAHHYTPAGFGPGAYPGPYEGVTWDRAFQALTFRALEGVQFARTHGVPLWLGEFGSTWSGLPAERPDRLRALDDLLAICNQEGVHWTIWSYKDVGAMGWVQVAPDAPYLRQIAPIIAAKDRLHTDMGSPWASVTPVHVHLTALATEITATLPNGWLSPKNNADYLAQVALGNYAGPLLQTWYAQQFSGLDEAALTNLAQSFAFEQCEVQSDILSVLQNRFHPL